MCQKCDKTKQVRGEIDPITVIIIIMWYCDNMIIVNSVGRDNRWVQLWYLWQWTLKLNILVSNTWINMSRFWETRESSLEVFSRNWDTGRGGPILYRLSLDYCQVKAEKSQQHYYCHTALPLLVTRRRGSTQQSPHSQSPHWAGPQLLGPLSSEQLVNKWHWSEMTWDLLGLQETETHLHLCTRHH